MRIAILCTFACAAMLAVPSVQAADTAQQSAMKSCAATWKTMSAADKAKTKYSDYMSGCMKAPAKTTTAATPASGSSSMAMTAKPAASSSSSMSMQAATGGQAKCKDGTVVTYKHRSGTCSGHHGVATWM